ncbi:MAG: PQQ-binding-like beta-propeller repeat protein [Acidimicrobiales bacterium]
MEDHDVLIAATERHRLSAQQRKPLPLEGALNPDNRALQHRSPRLELDGTENLKRNPAASQPEVQSGAPIATAATVSGVLAAPKRLRCPPASLVACGIIATGAVDSSPAVANGLVYVGSDDGHLNGFSSPGGMTSMAQRPPSPSRLRRISRFASRRSCRCALFCAGTGSSVSEFAGNRFDSFVLRSGVGGGTCSNTTQQTRWSLAS